jgi:GntR family transcriptional regulator, rspAB operon transcriptional repressor
MTCDKISGMNSSVNPDEIDSAKDLIYKELRRSIIMGHRLPGSRLIVNEIAQYFNTSITPVRDALQMLSQDGLVTIRPRSGYYVTALSLKELRDLLDFRRILELAAIEKAVLRITPEQIEALRNVHEGYTGEDDASYERYTEENRKFHYLIAVASGNMALAEALGHLHDRLARFMVVQQIGERQIRMHNQIIKAMEEHDLEGARQAILNEVNPSQEAILDTVMENGTYRWQDIG